jgi:N-acyl-D-aspartate/D-glutamate deacylase
MLDFILKNCTVIDGTGTPRYEADIAVKGDSIEEIGRLDHAVAKEEIDAHGLTVAPGFIDVHSHADFSLPLEDHDEVLSPLAMQGITTFVGGNCGFSTGTVPAARRREIMDNLESLSGRKLDEISWSTPSEFMSFMERRGMLLNVGLLAGHGTLRIGASGMVNRLLTGDDRLALSAS